MTGTPRRWPPTTRGPSTAGSRWAAGPRSSSSTSPARTPTRARRCTPATACRGWSRRRRGWWPTPTRAASRSTGPRCASRPAAPTAGSSTARCRRWRASTRATRSATWLTASRSGPATCGWSSVHVELFGTSLAASLTARGVDSLVIAGVSTSGCVRATAVDAVQHAASSRWSSARRSATGTPDPRGQPVRHPGEVRRGARRGRRARVVGVAAGPSATRGPAPAGQG